MRKGLLIIHIDGLSYQTIKRAVAAGKMPFIQSLLNNEYELLSYRCGLPSTTPFCQAGILYGDNHNIPSFRWWDKESGILVAFGANSSFSKVAHKYFQKSKPLIENGACISACYSGGAKETFGLAFEERNSKETFFPKELRKLAVFLVNPKHFVFWLLNGLWVLIGLNRQYLKAKLTGKRADKTYVFSQILQDIFLHQLTKYCVRQAVVKSYPIIYAGFYAYDETAHAFGSQSKYSLNILKHLDDDVKNIYLFDKTNGKRNYDLLILSDHGQVETIPFEDKYQETLGQAISKWLPTYHVVEHRGRDIPPRDDATDGQIVITYSGGLGHLYFQTLSGKLDLSIINEKFPGLISKMAKHPGIEFVLVKDGKEDNLFSSQGRFNLSDKKATAFLRKYDEPEIIKRQLQRLNSFETSGDLIIFGKWLDGQQINFEHQVGGHGSIGGEQLHPFLLVKKEWKVDTSRVENSQDLYPILKKIRDDLLPSEKSLTQEFRQ